MYHRKLYYDKLAQEYYSASNFIHLTEFTCSVCRLKGYVYSNRPISAYKEYELLLCKPGFDHYTTMTYEEAKERARKELKEFEEKNPSLKVSKEERESYQKSFGLPLTEEVFPCWVDEMSSRN